MLRYRRVDTVMAKDTNESVPEFRQSPDVVPEAQPSLFERASTNIDSVSKVSDHMRIGKRWDVTHKEIQGDVIVLRQGELITTKYGPAILAEIDHKGERKDALLGGMVLITAFDKLAPHFPIVTVIRMPGRAYIYDDPTEEELSAYRTAYAV